MGWGRMMLLGDWGQQWDIEDQREELAQMRQRMSQQAAGTQTTVEKLAADNAQLKMFVVAIMRVLVRKKLVTPEELEAIIDEVDREDGKQDGGLNAKVE